MITEQAVYSMLAGASGVTALCGTRIYPDEAPSMPALPYVVYQRIGTTPNPSHDQASVTAAQLDGCLFQVTAIAATTLAAASLMYQVRLAVERSASPRCLWSDERSVARDEGAQAYGRQGDFLVWHSPS